MSAPRPRGSPSVGEREAHGSKVRPTRMGVARPCSAASRPRPCPPHPRGGRPLMSSRHSTRAEHAPYRWGCPYRIGDRIVRGQACPTPVGVVHGRASTFRHRARTPHPRGGHPETSLAIQITLQRAPRRWGSPRWRQRHGRPPRPAPPAWGSPVLGTCEQPPDATGPTPVGVARPSTYTARPTRHRPHARGGGPTAGAIACLAQRSAPPAWGSPRGIGPGPSTAGTPAHTCGRGPRKDARPPGRAPSGPRPWASYLESGEAARRRPARAPPRHPASRAAGDGPADGSPRQPACTITLCENRPPRRRPLPARSRWRPTPVGVARFSP